MGTRKSIQEFKDKDPEKYQELQARAKADISQNFAKFAMFAEVFGWFVMFSVVMITYKTYESVFGKTPLEDKDRFLELMNSAWETVSYKDVLDIPGAIKDQYEITKAATDS